MNHTIWPSPIGELTRAAFDLPPRARCHRVLGKDGELRGYAGGPRRKRFPLELEQPGPYAAAG